MFIIQRKVGRLAGVLPDINLDDLYNNAEQVQGHLARITAANAPNLRYSIILGELQQETRRALKSGSAMHFPQLPVEPEQENGPSNIPDMGTGANVGETPSDWDTHSFDFPLDPNLWLQLDSFPFSKLPCVLQAELC